MTQRYIKSGPVFDLALSEAMKWLDGPQHAVSIDDVKDAVFNTYKETIGDEAAFTVAHQVRIDDLQAALVKLGTIVVPVYKAFFTARIRKAALGGTFVSTKAGDVQKAPANPTLVLPLGRKKTKNGLVLASAYPMLNTAWLLYGRAAANGVWSKYDERLGAQYDKNMLPDEVIALIKSDADRMVMPATSHIYRIAHDLASLTGPDAMQEAVP
jgi:hypothetical protein